MNIPAAIESFLTERNKRSDSPCKQCNAACCHGPGFAILENVIKIYAKYTRGALQRDDFTFKPNLSLSQFIFQFFDRTIINGRLLVFFPKTLSENGGLNSVPPWQFWEARDYLNKRNPAFGCVFLAKKKASGDLSYNYCLLHNSKMNSEITEKPNDCTFLICAGLRNVQKPTNTESGMWFSLLDFYFPDSIERFNKMCPDIVE